jgi:hypothetical protein
MPKYQPNPELMLDSKTHSKPERIGRIPELAGCPGSAAFGRSKEKTTQSALDFSHSNPEFCHPKFGT